MSARQQLLSLYEQWRTLTEGETQAIHRGDWDGVHGFQDAKRDLQPGIFRQTEHALEELGRDAQVKADFDDQLRRIVNTLILLEQRNGTLIAERKEACRQEMDQVEQGQRNLTKIHKSYGNRREAVWNSYS